VWNILRLLLGKDPKDSYVKCPFCSHRAPLKEFVYWERNGVSGFRGKMANGDMVVACPECLVELKYDALSGSIVVYKL
jgi:DNA-directed RNA polymerase subunit RPC12/RpoP